MRKLFKPLLFGALSIYLLICATIYFLQNQLLFPGSAAQAVAHNWAPTLSNNDTQAMIAGQCGQLHVVRWAVPNDKGNIMIFHGNGESVASVQDQVPKFQKLGYSVMAWDYPGYGKSTACWFNENDLLRDSENAYQWLIKQIPDNQAPESHILLYGRSVGTGLALHVASQHQVKLVLLVSPYDALVNVSKTICHFLFP
jgi:alpha-beta hydrolase superfamily lysophospholipase